MICGSSDIVQFHLVRKSNSAIALDLISLIIARCISFKFIPRIGVDNILRYIHQAHLFKNQP